MSALVSQQHQVSAVQSDDHHLGGNLMQDTNLRRKSYLPNFIAVALWLTGEVIGQMGTESHAKIIASTVHFVDALVQVHKKKDCSEKEIKKSSKYSKKLDKQEVK